MSHNPNEYFYQRHDEQLQQLEGDLSQVRVDVAVLKSDVHNLQLQLGEGFSTINDKLDALLKLEPRVTALEVSEGRRESRVKVAVRVIGATISTFVAGLLFFWFGIHR